MHRVSALWGPVMLLEVAGCGQDFSDWPRVSSIHPVSSNFHQTQVLMPQPQKDAPRYVMWSEGKPSGWEVRLTEAWTCFGHSFSLFAQRKWGRKVGARERAKAEPSIKEKGSDLCLKGFLVRFK